MGKDSLKQAIACRELIKAFKYREVESLLQNRRLDPNAWLRFDGEEGEEEEATGLMIVCRVAATAAEKREVRRSSEPLSSSSSSSLCTSSQLANRKNSDNNHSRGSMNSSISEISEADATAAAALTTGMAGGSLLPGLGKVSRDRIRMAALFVNHGADVNMRDARGRTALMYASMNGLSEVVYYLLVITGADYRIQEHEGSNSLMFALPFPAIVRIFLDAMSDAAVARPDSSFWRQRTRYGKSIFDLAKESCSSAIIASNNGNVGSHKSLQLLTAFITDDQHYQSFKAPAPLPEQLIQLQNISLRSVTTDPQEHRRRHHHHHLDDASRTEDLSHENSRNRRKSTRSNGSSSGFSSSSSSSSAYVPAVNGSSKADVQSHGTSTSPQQQQQQSGLVDVLQSDQQLNQMEQSMKRSRSLKEFWEKETIDWFTSSESSHSQSPVDGLMVPIYHQTQKRNHHQQRSSPQTHYGIPAVVVPTMSSKSPHRPSRSGPSSSDASMIFIPINDHSHHVDRSPSLSAKNAPTDASLIKLPPIASPLIRHEEWRQRGHSLNRRTSVTLLRTVNPIH